MLLKARKKNYSIDITELDVTMDEQEKTLEPRHAIGMRRKFKNSN